MYQLKINNDRLNVVWIAATRGAQYISNDKILELDVGLLADDVKTYLFSQKKVKLSLRFSAILLNGLVKIFDKRVRLIFGLASDILIQLYKPSVTLFPREQKSQVQKKPIVRAKKTRIHREKIKEEDSSLEKELLTIDLEARVQLPELPPAVEAAHEEQITLRENLVPKSDQLFQGGEQDFGILTDEELRQFLEGGESAALPLPKPPQEPTIQGEIAAATTEQPIVTISEQPSVPVSQQVTAHLESRHQDECIPHQIEVEVEIHAPPKRLQDISMQLIPQIEEERLREAEKFDSRPKPKTSKKQLFPSEEIVSAAVAPSDTLPGKSQTEPITAKTVEPKRKAQEDIARKYGLLIDNKKQKKIYYLDRYNPKDFASLIVKSPPILPKFRICETNLTNLLNMFFIPDEIRNLPPSTPKRSRSVSAERDTSKSTERTMRPSVGTPQLPIGQSTPLQRRRTESMEEPTQQPQTIEKTVAVVTRKRTQYQLKLPSLVETEDIPFPQQEAQNKPGSQKDKEPVELQIESVSQQIGPTGTPSEILSGVTGSQTDSSLLIEVQAARKEILEQRQKILIDKVSVSAAALLIEDVCPLPQNRLNMARTFADLLVLAKYGYVNLVQEKNDLNSNVLKSIEKGPKLLIA